MYNFYYNKKCQIIIILLTTVVASFVSAYLSLDAIAYQRIFARYSASGWLNILTEIRGHEIFFIMSAKVLSEFPSLIWFFCIALLSVTLKICLMVKTSRIFYWSYFFYLAYFFVLLDGTQIRVSLAIIIAFWGAYFFSIGRNALATVIIVLSALFFHYSLSVFLIIFLFKSKRITSTLIVLWPLSVALWFLGFDFLSVFKFLVSYTGRDWVGFNQLHSYINYWDPKSAPFSLQFIFLYFAALLVYWRYRDDLTDFERICFNCVFFSLVVLVFFVGASGLQNRLSEIFRFGLVFVFPLFYRFCLEFTNKAIIANFLIGASLIGYFYYYVLFLGLITWPKDWGVFL